MGRRLLLIALFGLAACDQYARPNRPLPSDFEVATLDGRVLVPRDFQGRPWLINLWVPG